MRRTHAGLLLAVLIMAACALPIEPPPTLVPPLPSAAPPAARLPAGAIDSTATPLPATTAALPAPTTPGPGADELSRIAAAIPLPRDQVTLAEALKGITDVPAVARTTPLDVKVGDVETFWIANFV